MTPEDGRELGLLLDRADAATEGDSNDEEFDALREALEYAVGLLVELGLEVPRSSGELDR